MDRMEIGGMDLDGDRDAFSAAEFVFVSSSGIMWRYTDQRPPWWKPFARRKFDRTSPIGGAWIALGDEDDYDYVIDTRRDR